MSTWTRRVVCQLVILEQEYTWSVHLVDRLGRHDRGSVEASQLFAVCIQYHDTLRGRCHQLSTSVTVDIRQREFFYVVIETHCLITHGLAVRSEFYDEQRHLSRVFCRF